MKKILFVLCCCMGLSVTLFAQPDRIWSTYFGKYNPGMGTHVSSSVYDPVSRCLYVAGTTSDTSGIAPGQLSARFSTQYAQ